MDKKLLNKHGEVTTKLARRVMALDPGDRLPTIVELTEDFGVSRGVVQNAIAFLEKHKDVPFYMNVWGHITHHPIQPQQRSAIAQHHQLAGGRASLL